MSNNVNEGSTLACTASGTLLVAITNITTGDILKTAILAAIGAIVSFIASKLMKKIWSKLK